LLCFIEPIVGGMGFRGLLINNVVGSTGTPLFLFQQSQPVSGSYRPLTIVFVSRFFRRPSHTKAAGGVTCRSCASMADTDGIQDQTVAGFLDSLRLSNLIPTFQQVCTVCLCACCSVLVLKASATVSWCLAMTTAVVYYCTRIPYAIYTVFTGIRERADMS
jgi:hypothetical protein